jgi:hypothetical protein
MIAALPMNHKSLTIEETNWKGENNEGCETKNDVDEE